MRTVSLTSEELSEIRRLYQSVMSDAAFGLLVREGSILGQRVVDAAQASADPSQGQSFLDAAARILIELSWAHAVTFEGAQVTVVGSVEAERPSAGAVPTCHRLRGILRKLYEAQRGQKVYCKELECASAGGPRCLFEIGTMSGWGIGEGR